MAHMAERSMHLAGWWLLLPLSQPATPCHAGVGLINTRWLDEDS